MENNKPNIILIMADQFRYDAIGAHGNANISTPTLNEMISKGIDFSNAYSATPTCIPARASLMSGLSQINTGIVGYEEGLDWNFPNYLGGAFAERGYYAKAIGKMHVSPPRKLCGFHHVELHDGYMHATRKESRPTNQTYEYTDDYLSWLRNELRHNVDLHDNGLDCNSWVARPFPYEERLHPTNWAVEKSIDFLKKRDPTMPFFLKLSFVRPHQPLDPPEYYFNMYLNEFNNISGPDYGKWAEELGLLDDVEKVDSLTGKLSDIDYKRMVAGYYGLVTHMDHQINRFLISLKEHEQLKNSIILFTSDHGEQLGVHGLFRKGFAYQDSIHIPLIVYDPGQNIAPTSLLKKEVDHLVELRDILPTLVDLATGDELENVDGKSFRPLMLKHTKLEDLDWRKYIHGEHILAEHSNQYIVGEEWKYIWMTQTGLEQLFNLLEDPEEKYDLSNLPEHEEVLEKMRNLLIKELEDRPEGFVENDQLISGKKQSPGLPKNQQWSDK